MRDQAITAPMSTVPSTTRDSNRTLVQLGQPFGARDATLCSREHTKVLAPAGSQQLGALAPPQSQLRRAPIPKIVAPWPVAHSARVSPHSHGPQTVIALVRNPVLGKAQLRSLDTARCRLPTRPDRTLAQAIMMLSLGVIAGVLIATCAHPLRSGAARLARHISTLQVLRA